MDLARLAIVIAEQLEGADVRTDGGSDTLRVYWHRHFGAIQESEDGSGYKVVVCRAESTSLDPADVVEHVESEDAAAARLIEHLRRLP